MRTKLQWCVIVLTANCVAQLGAGAEAPITFSSEQISKAVVSAPKLPVDLGFGLTTKLVDYVDFTADDPMHDLRDRGTSRVVEGPAGRYRETARHRHAFFAVRWQAEQINKPHLLVFEYPDDAQRQICFFTHESKLSGKRNIDWSLETGVNCGDPFPLSNAMQYHTFFFWPADRYPVAMVMNWARNKTGAAASRLWVYAVEGELPALQVKEPDPAHPRILGNIYNWSLVPRQGIYGLADETSAFEHMVDYHRFRGDNLISWPVVANNSWCFRCTIPAWDGGEQSTELDNVLAACEKKGVKFLPIFNSGLNFKLGGKDDASSDPAERRALIEKGSRQFLDRYGKSPSLYGLAFDTQDLSPKYGEGALDQWRKSFGSLKTFRAFIKDLAPDLPVFHFLGGRHIHAQYFDDAGDVLDRWEAGNLAWDEHLGNEVGRLWTEWTRDPAELNGDGIETILGFQADDARIFDTYYQNPRASFYWDLEASPTKASLVDTTKAMVWNTFYEGYIGLNPENWWYLKLWVAPDFNPAPPVSLQGWTQAMAHRDRDLLMTGAWNRKAGGIESSLRRFALAYRALPPVELKPVQIAGSSPLIARAATWQDRTYVNVINHTPFANQYSVNGQPTSVEPFGIGTHVIDGAATLSGEVAPAYAAWVRGRLDRYADDMAELKGLEPFALPAAYERHGKRAEALYAERKIYEADQALGQGLPHEIELRLSILKPRQLAVPRATQLPSLDIALDKWPAEAADWQTDDRHIATHLFFPNQWEGPADLSARIRCLHDGKKLAMAIRVADQALEPKDGAKVHFSPANYRVCGPQKMSYEHAISFMAPADDKAHPVTGSSVEQGTVRRVEGGYEAVLILDLAKLGIGDGNRIGWIVVGSDNDPKATINNDRWGRKQALAFPNDPLFEYWGDARSCGELVLAP